ncbi:MAG TPA: FtsX-like permease family protein [Bryobacteraceae bacterium]|nr:FtsX-like permease family protein [Bryobacteraceae bacterium]
MFWSFVLRAVEFRKRRLVLAFAALAVAATLATALFSVYSDIERKMRAQFREYGANMVIAPEGGSQTVPLEAVAAAERQGAAAAPFIYTVGRVDSEPVVVAGTDFRRAAQLTDYWRVDGARAATPGECLLGSAVAAHFRLRIGDKLALDGAPCVVRGIVSSGGAEDQQAIVPLETAAQLAGLRDAVSLVQVRADGAKLPAVAAALSNALPGVDVRVLHAVAETEANVVLKLRSTLFLLTALILAITTLCVTNNFSALVLERSQEIGVLKAIGAAERKIAALFLSESLILGLVSTAAGYGFGLLVAWWIGRQIFPEASAAGVGVNFGVFLPVTGVTLVVATAATLAAAARIWRIKPAVILRGE